MTHEHDREGQGRREADAETKQGRAQGLAALQTSAARAGRALFLIAVPEDERARLIAALSEEKSWDCVALDSTRDAVSSDAVSADSVSADAVPSDAVPSDEGSLTAALLRRIASDDKELRLEAVEALSGAAMANDPAVTTALSRALEDSAAPVREGAARAFARLGRLDVLADGLAEARAASRRCAAWALGLIGEASRPMVPDLIRVLSDPDPATRRAVAWALERITTAPMAEKTRIEEMGIEEMGIKEMADEAALPRSERSPRELLDYDEFERWLRAGVRRAYDGRAPEHPGQLRLYGQASRSGRARVS